MTSTAKKITATYLALSSLTLTAVAAAVSSRNKNALTSILAAAAAESLAGAALLYHASKTSDTDYGIIKKKKKKHRIRRLLDVSSLFNDNDYRGFTIADESGRLHECTLYELRIDEEKKES